MANVNRSAGVNFGVFAFNDRLRWLFFLVVFASGLAGGIYAHTSWIKFALLAVAACTGLVMFVELLTRFLFVCVDNQRWKYKLWDENGKTILVPNPDIQGEDVKRIFGHPDVNAKTASGLRQLIRWWHAPCSDCHQEIMERNDLYVQVRSVTGRILSKPLQDARQLARTHLDEAMLRQHTDDAAWSITKLRSIVGPMAMSFCYEFVFRRRCPPEILPLLVGSTADVNAATGAMSRRNMPLRMKAFMHVKSVLEDEAGRPDIFGDDCTLTLEQRTQYLQGVWIHTAAAQILRLTCNAICHLSRNRRCLEIVKREIGEAGSYAEAVLLETLRLTPGINSTNRVASKDIAFSEKVSIPSGANLVFDLELYHRTGFDGADEFIPERWSDDKNKDSNFMPFGVGKRRCPAERLVLVVAKEMMLGILASLDVYVPAGRGLLFSTTPRIANDLCCIVRRPSLGGLRLWGVLCWLSCVLMVENVRKSFIQLAIMPKNAGDAIRESDCRTTRQGAVHETNQ